MKKKTFTPLRGQRVRTEPRPVSTDQVDGVAMSSEAMDIKLAKLNTLRQRHHEWSSRQAETDGKPLLRYIDGYIKRVIHYGDLKQIEAA
ncbi:MULTISPECIES: hypothetical protein [Henriciella]|jgi:hypothetical protein|uniref:hypothetical protein n=1 Tax=Henriciella TaxID=453849 RepID=UPI003512B177